MNYIVKATDFDYNTNKEIIEALISKYPFLSVELCGRTAPGKGIFSLNIGNMTNSVILVAGLQGSDRLSCLLLFLFAERLCRSIKLSRSLCGVDMKKTLSQLGVTIIPCLNPDGIEISAHGSEGAGSMRKFVQSLGLSDYSSYNANALGVDIERNFSPFFGNCSDDGVYAGEYPESQAETKALTRLCRLRHFRQCLELHTAGREIFWQHGCYAPSQASMMAKILADCCGYSLPCSTDYSSGNFKNWFIGEFNRPGFSIKAGKGDSPLPESKLYEVYAEIEEALTLICLM